MREQDNAPKPRMSDEIKALFADLSSYKLYGSGDIYSGAMYNPHTSYVEFEPEYEMMSDKTMGTGLHGIQYQTYGPLVDIKKDFDPTALPMLYEHDLESVYQAPPRAHKLLGIEAIMADRLDVDSVVTVESWVHQSIRISYGQPKPGYRGVLQRELYVGSLDDPFFVENRDEILVRAVTIFRAQPNESLQKLIDTLTEGKGVPTGLIDAVVLASPNLVLDTPNIFPDFRFTMAHIESMIASPDLLALMQKWELIEPACLQQAVDFIIDNKIEYMSVFETALPPGVTLTQQQVVTLATHKPLMLHHFFSNGLLAEWRSNLFVLRSMSDAGRYDLTEKSMSNELLTTIDFATLSNALGDHMHDTIALRLLELGRLDTEEDMYAYIEIASAIVVSGYVNQLPATMRSICFKEMVSKPSSAGQWVYYAERFSGLQDEDYTFIIDNIDDFIERDMTAMLRGLFANVPHDVQVRFENEVLPMLAKVDEEQMQRQLRNANRESRREIEEGYFNAGNIVPVTYSNDETLSNEDIARAFESEHCVRTIGRLEDMAHDTTRTNQIAGLLSQYLSKTDSLGSGIADEDRVVYTEHGALQELVSYLRDRQAKTPDRKLFENLLNNLSFVGEKEYAEAVKGIATYWKWFMDQDSENQLYIDTIVTNRCSNIKSDVYMFDRILEHFTDEDLEKYWGQLLTKGADIIQDDPRKVKVVLLDDWTISGSQLRNGYKIIVGARPDLARSVEVQLIAASAERVTMGLEGLYHTAAGHVSALEQHVPVVTRAYYLAHESDTTGSEAKGARITGGHSSVDFGFANDLGREVGRDGDKFPLLVNVIRSYRQDGYETKNINRLKVLYGL